MHAFRAKIEAVCVEHGLTVLGLTRQDDATVVLIGTGPKFWPLFKESAEYFDEISDPIDRWSTRILPIIQTELNAIGVVYPFGSPPYRPFVRWLLESGEAVRSPYGMLWHHRAGFWISVRGALLFNEPSEINTPQIEYAGPSGELCPASAMTPQSDYDVAACKAYLKTTAGGDCLGKGCRGEIAESW